MDSNYPYQVNASLKASTVNKLIEASQFYTNSGTIGGVGNAVVVQPTNEQGLADITDSHLGDIRPHSVIYAVAKDDGSGFTWYRTRQKGAQAYYTLGNTQIECVGTVVGENEDGSKIVSENEGKIMVAVKPMIVGEKYVLYGMETLQNGAPAYWNGYRLCPLSGSHVRDFIIQKTETNIQLPFTASGTNSTTGEQFYPEVLFSEDRPFTAQVVVLEEDNLEVVGKPAGWEDRTMKDIYGNNVAGAISPTSGQFWVQATGRIGVVVPYLTYSQGQTYWRGFDDPVWPTDVNMPGMGGVIDGSNYNPGLDTPVSYAEADENSYAEAVYNPAEEEDNLEGLAKIVFPVNYPPMQNNLVPNPVGVKWKYDSYTGAEEEDETDIRDEARGAVPFLTGGITARGFTACSMGTADLTGTPIKEYQPAYYSSLDRVKFEVYALTYEKQLPTEAPTAYQGCYDLQFTWSVVKKLDKNNTYLLKCTGTFMPDPLGTPIIFSYDPMVTGGTPCYQRKFSVVQENSYVKRADKLFPDAPYEFMYKYDDPVEETFKVGPPVVPGCIFTGIAEIEKKEDSGGDSDDPFANADDEGTTYDEDEEAENSEGDNQGDSGGGGSDSGGGGSDSGGGEKETVFVYMYGKVKVYIPVPKYDELFQDEYGEKSYGDIVLKSIDDKTGFMTWTFIGDGGPNDEDENATSVDDEVPVKLATLPFWYGFTRGRRMRITTKMAQAQKKFMPVFCPTLDKNEVLIPGELFEWEKAEVSLTTRVHKRFIAGSDWVPPDENEDDNSGNSGSGDNQGDNDAPYKPTPDNFTTADVYVETEAVTFKYLILTPVPVYHTDIDCTPETKVRTIKYKIPTADEINTKRIIEGDDLFVVEVQDKNEAPEENVPHTMYYGIPTTTNSVSDVREPFGAFNDCGNADALALWVKKDSNDVKYPCTCRLDYIPYGYALATKTPSCFFKATAEENCAPRLKGVTYDLTRVEGKLLVNGGCYVPCTSLATK